ncbi:MAG TPA: outer membrane beta-barrel protein [Chitinophagales bacterium]|nr:outer membrane beta-barrel protein [Chitinophagales bacterium]
MSPNELDDFLKRKEAEFDVPFREEYWDKAQALLQRERRHRPAAFWNARTLGLSGVVALLGGMAVWFALSTHPVSQPGTNNAANSPAPTPYRESKDYAVVKTDNANNNAVATNDQQPESTSSNSSNDNYNTVSSNSSASVAGVATTTSTSSVNGNANSSNRVSVNTGVANTTVNNRSANSNSAVTSSISINATANNNLNSGNNARSASAGATASASTRPSLNAPLNADASKTEMSLVRSLNKSRIHYRQVSTIPVFEDMTPNDPALMRFYGLYYNGSGAASRKIREFKNLGQYPQITWSAVGGVNVFNHLKEEDDSLNYVSTNPYLGVKFGLQWNPKMSVCIQPTLAQRGGVRLFDYHDAYTAANKAIAFRHLYYLQVPVTVGFQFSKRNNISFGGGPAVLLTTGTRLQNLETEDLEGKYKFKQSDGFKRIDYFATAGYQFRMNKKVGFQASFKYGLTDVTSDAHFGVKQNHHNLQASIGLTYQFYQEKLQLR